MRIIGQRVDGATALLVLGKVILLHGERCSRPMEESEYRSFGPWQTAPSVGADMLNNLQRQLDRARVVGPAAFKFNLAEWDESQHPRDDKGRFGEGNSNAGSEEAMSAEKLASGRDRIAMYERSPKQRGALKEKHPVEFHSGAKWGAEGQPTKSFLEEADYSYDRGTSEHDAMLAGFAYGRKEAERSSRHRGYGSDYKPLKH